MDNFRTYKNTSRLDKELVGLFGKDVVAKSKQVSIDDMAIEAELVAEGARQLIEQKGKPAAQRSIVSCMDSDTAIALCKWIQEPQAISMLAIV